MNGINTDATTIPSTLNITAHMIIMTAGNQNGSSKSFPKKNGSINCLIVSTPMYRKSNNHP